ncbi:MAG: zinc ribbon domain-containing protein [Clostridiales bacterium]|jgi:putative FmdB family regulatory protein|nr:zinc ribbon domain-containing protein [Clostridiales bacterium]
MPTYEYVCKNCRNRFEVMVPSADKMNVKCPSCESCELQEVYSVNVQKSAGNSCEQIDSCPSRRFGFG